MRQLTAINVTADFDEEAGVWFVVDCSVPGLVTEAPSLDALFEKVAMMAGDLLDLDDKTGAEYVPVHLLAQRDTRIAH